MKSIPSHFGASLLCCGLALLGAWLLGGFKAVLTAAFLTMLEISLSFDNAVVNAGVLRYWNAAWRRRFLTWGILIAVFGMRLVFPLVIVGVAGHLEPWHVLDLAINFPDEYGRILASLHHEIAAFGGAFLMMVFFNFFVARHKTEHWLKVIERPLARLGKLESIEAALTLALILFAAALLDTESLRPGFVVAGVWGVIIYIFSKGLAALMGGDQQGDAARQVIRQGVGGFVYLELLDASFSFDGVVGAFAMTSNLFIIALGLGAGAMFVRAFTLLMVERHTLNHFRYLEHGAFWAIGGLAAIMLLGVEYHIPEAVTGLLGGLLIAFSLISSVVANRREPE